MCLHFDNYSDADQTEETTEAPAETGRAPLKFNRVVEMPQPGHTEAFEVLVVDAGGGRSLVTMKNLAPQYADAADLQAYVPGDLDRGADYASAVLTAYGQPVTQRDQLVAALTGMAAWLAIPSHEFQAEPINPSAN
jgi:hypothetical protein